LRLLIIDDDDLIGERLELDLTARGHAVSRAVGHAALKLLSAQPWDAVVIDILMPEVDGVEMILEAKRQPKPPRIIGISGGGKFSAEHYLALADTFGADASFRKPLDFAAVARAIDVAGETPPAPAGQAT